MPVNHDYESGATLASQSYTSITDLAATSGEGLTGSTWGVRGTGTLAQRSNARANLPTGGSGRNFLVEFDLDHVDVNSSFRSTLTLLSGTVGGNNFFLTIDSDLGDGHIEIYSYETPGFGGVTPIWSSAAGLVVAGVSKRWSLCGELSSASGITDGSITFKIDGAIQTTVSSLVLWGNALFGGTVAEIRIAPHGRFDNLSVSNAGCSAAPVIPPLQRAGYVLFSSNVVEKQVQTRLTKTGLMILAADPPSGTAPVSLTLTQVTGDLYDQEGNTLTTGRLIVTPRGPIAANDELVAAVAIQYDVTGPISLNLAPSNGTLYDVEYDPDPTDDETPINLKTGYFKDVWNIPGTSPVDIADL